ncbi:MAG: DUF4097 family beta strand repeat-containing protein [Candidatus Hatepunaea meridiana]|nr:DUF4097 family beta strand repeat-containing protein [Candidatus Hatepunaea meridiana]
MTTRQIINRNPIFILSLSLVILLTLTALPALAKITIEDSYNKVMEAAGFEDVSIETVNGSIEVTGYDGDQVTIDAKMEVKGKKEDICKELLSEIEIKINEKGKELEIEADTKDKRGYSVSVSFKIQVPHRMKIEAETVNGSIDVTDINGGANIETINGSLNCSNMICDVDAETINGSINFDDVSGELDAETINGSIDCESALEPPQSISFETINGKVNVELKGIPDAKLNIAAVNGNIKLKGFAEVELKRNARSFSSTLGSGAGSYDISTVNGSVTFELKK